MFDGEEEDKRNEYSIKPFAFAEMKGGDGRLNRQQRIRWIEGEDEELPHNVSDGQGIQVSEPTEET